MKAIKYISIVVLLGLFLNSCGSVPVKADNDAKEEPVVIANEDLQYEIIIIDVGFTRYLQTVARPEGFYSQPYLENKNRIYVSIWNNRVRNPSQFNPNIYENIIDYDPNIDYGYEVNYKLFNYFEFAQQKYKMTLR